MRARRCGRCGTWRREGRGARYSLSLDGRRGRQAPHDGVGTYPDESVVCGERRFSDDTHDERTNPAVIFEVLSPPTESYDRGEKFAHYRTIESLREYVLIASELRRVDVFRRRDDGVWELRSYAAGGFELASLGVQFEVDALSLNTGLNTGLNTERAAVEA